MIEDRDEEGKGGKDYDGGNSNWPDNKTILNDTQRGIRDAV